mgnify:FL=1
MSDFITLTCPNCSGKLQITDDINRFACMYCGVEHLVRRGGGIVTLQPVVDELKKVNTGLSGIKGGVDHMASELAIQRLQKEIPELYRKRQALVTALGSGMTPQGPSALQRFWFLVQALAIWLVLFILIGIAVIDFTDSDFIFVVGALGVPTVVALRYIDRRKRIAAAAQKPSESARRLQAEIDKLDEEIAEAKRELAQHKQLVRQIDN